jgi:hypothetical protein
MLVRVSSTTQALPFQYSKVHAGGPLPATCSP